ncbi:hypothetical protein DRO59_03340 [Candidatus Bathyarchaeota archaeon]|nr:MAG: hypothetical protein DRO59_03340 [Candidatus Bathyarchaeota archaeon]
MYLVELFKENVNLRKELIKAEKSLLSRVHPAVALETTLYATLCVQFKTRLPGNVMVELKFKDKEFGDNEVDVRFPYLAVTSGSIRLKGCDTRAITLVKLKDALCGVNAPQRRLLKLSKSFSNCLGAWRQAPLYLNPVTIRTRCACWSRLEPHFTFRIQGVRLLSVMDVVYRAGLQWYVYLFNKRYGDYVVQRWGEFLSSL